MQKTTLNKINVITLALVSMVSLTYINGEASTTSPFWDAGTSGTGFQNIYFNSGFVGIGKQPSAKLDVGGSGEPFRISNFQNSNQYLFGGYYLGTANIGAWDSTNGAKALSLNSKGGNVGIGKSNPSYPLDVNGVISSSDTGIAPGTPMLRVGDDTYMTDLDQPNSLGIYGQLNSNQVRIKLGSNGGWLTSNNGEVCLGAC